MIGTEERWASWTRVVLRLHPPATSCSNAALVALGNFGQVTELLYRALRPRSWQAHWARLR